MTVIAEYYFKLVKSCLPLFFPASWRHNLCTSLLSPFTAVDVLFSDMSQLLLGVRLNYQRLFINMPFPPINYSQKRSRLILPDICNFINRFIYRMRCSTACKYSSIYFELEELRYLQYLWLPSSEIHENRKLQYYTIMYLSVAYMPTSLALIFQIFLY